jgi:hypothetical protein
MPSMSLPRTDSGRRVRHAIERLGRKHFNAETQRRGDSQRTRTLQSQTGAQDYQAEKTFHKFRITRPDYSQAFGWHHRRIRAVRDGIADARFLAFKLKPKPALSRRSRAKAEVGV